MLAPIAAAARGHSDADQPTYKPTLFRLILTGFIPFAAGYFLSYLFRTVNALLSGRLIADLHLDAADLGLLTSTYLLTAAMSQIPLGMAIDRFGPRKVQGTCLLVAAAGAAMFSFAGDLVGLLLARALIGVGVSSALVSGMKFITMNFPASRAAILNGIMISMGGAGAITASVPLEWVLAAITWRDLFLWLSGATAVVAVLIFALTPRDAARPTAGHAGAPSAGLRDVLLDGRFWRLAPLSATVIGSAWAMQGLWASPWLRDVAGYDQHDVVGCLFLMACVFGISAVTLGYVVSWLGRRGIGPERVYGVVVAAVVLAELSMSAAWPIPPWLPWLAVAFSGAGTVLTFTIMPNLFAKTVVARANGLMNVLNFGGAFLIQNFVGQIVSLWPRDAAGHYPVAAYGTAFTVLACSKVLAFIWFWRPWAAGAVAASDGRLQYGRAAGALAGTALVATIAAVALMAGPFVSRAGPPASASSLSASLPPSRSAAAASDADGTRLQSPQDRWQIAALRRRVAHYEAELAAIQPELADLRRQVQHLQDAAFRPAAAAAPPAERAEAASARPTSSAPAAAIVRGCDPAASRAPLVLQFDRKQDILKVEHHATLDGIVAVLAACPKLAIELAGYSDSRGAPSLNKALSLRRAELTARYLEAHGVDPERMSVDGRADADAVDSNATADGRARNRRVEVRLKKPE